MEASYVLQILATIVEAYATLLSVVSGFYVILLQKRTPSGGALFAGFLLCCAITITLAGDPTQATSPDFAFVTHLLEFIAILGLVLTGLTISNMAQLAGSDSDVSLRRMNEE